ncbi:DUF1453 family protein [Amycolatopsis orientalis]|uniref:DUF1453 family protein n=1 Tax=Amycolatopsis orientalis TaxID=31958 RepID=UPI00039A92BE|nr:DUF1453 family protein [Amycolatopsis orientalis]
MGGWVLAGLVGGVVVTLVFRALGEPLNWRDVVAPPAVLIAIGIAGVVGFPEVTGFDVWWIVGGCVVGLTFGAARGATIRLYAKNGELWQRYRKSSLALFVLGVAASAGFTVLAVKFGMHEQARPYQLAIGVSFAGEALVLIPRGLRSDLPFATDKERPWDKLLRSR